MPRGVSRALYAGNGQAVEFPFFFRVWEEEQLSVLLTAPTGETTLATGWTVALDEDGGTVRYLHNGAPLPEGWKLAVMRDMPFVQEVDLVTGTRFDPEVIETALDVATAERQQLRERLARAVVVAPTSEERPEDLLADIAASRIRAVGSATAAAESATAAAGSAGAASGSAASAASSAGESAESAARAQAWAESETPPDPDDLGSKSAKTWAAIAADVVPIATPEMAGKVRPQTGAADGLLLEADGRLKARLATLAQAGIVRPDGTTITIRPDGAISVAIGSVYELGEIYYFRNPTLRPGFQPCQGGLLPQAATLYPQIWAYLQTAEGQQLCTTESEWQAMTRAAWGDGSFKASFNGIGGAPYFVQDLSAGTLRMPDIRGMVAMAAADGIIAPGAGGAMGDASRNITGRIGITYAFFDSLSSENRVTDGAFSLSRSSLSSGKGSNANGFTEVAFTSSNVVPTSAVNMPRSWGALACAYLGLPAPGGNENGESIPV